MRAFRTVTSYAWLSIAVALATIVLKAAAYWVTGSVGLLSDAVESLVNLAGALMALAMLTVAARPADDEHAYGHSKAEYFSSGVEGALILVASLSIAVTAIQRLLHPRPLEDVGVGLAVSVAASLLNLAAALVIGRAGRRYHSVTLVANSRHLLTDVWTSAGVVVGVAGVWALGWSWLDPVIALAVAANILVTAVRILSESVHGLMDASLPATEVESVARVLQPYVADGIEYHALQTRRAGARRFVSLHVLVPGDWTVDRGHRLVERIEADIRGVLVNATVSTHLESLHDPASWDDMGLDRHDQPRREPPPA